MLDARNRSTRHPGPAFLALTLLAALSPEALAGGPFKRRAQPTYQPTVETVVIDNRPAPPMLGSFYPTPYVTVRGNGMTGGGYSPNSIYGDGSMALYGPFSPFRSVSAPVNAYQRGYDGRLYPTTATGTSNPNLPDLSPVVYPTQFNNHYSPRSGYRTDPRNQSGFGWVDLN